MHQAVSRLCVSLPVPPTLLGSGEVRTVTVASKGHLTLECLADSDPAPEIEWYKNDVKLQVEKLVTKGHGSQKKHSKYKIM